MNTYGSLLEVVIDLALEDSEIVVYVNKTLLTHSLG